MRRAPLLGAVCGAVAVDGAVLAVKLWAGLRGLPGTRLELALVIAIGVLPPACAYAATRHRPRSLDAPRSLRRVNQSQVAA
ncbi:MAG: hypothetical protein WKG00_32465 [Polyangiaceae bacterium]